MSPAAPLAGCACAAAGTAAARPPAASMPCRKPRRSFVLESIVVLALVYANGLYDNHALSRRRVAADPVLSWSGPRIHQVALHQVRIPHSHARRQTLFTSVYVPKDTSEKYPIMLERTPYSVSPTASKTTRPPSAPRRSSPEKASSSSTRTCAAATCPKASSSTCRRIAPSSGPAGHRRKHRHLRHHRLAGEERPQQQRQRRHVGHLVSGLLHRGGHDRRASRAESRFPAGAHGRLVHRRRFPSQRRALPAAHVPFLLRASAIRAPSPPCRPPPRPNPPAHPAGWLQLFPRARAALQHQREVSSRTTSPSGRR